jgi:hypothetical protein
MKFIEDAKQRQKDVGATAEARLIPLTPLIEYYEREMGDLSGRLMIAASFLGDMQLMPEWSSQTPELREAIEQAQALVVSVMIRLLNMQESDGCGCGGRGEHRPAADVQRLLDQLWDGA